MIVFSIAGIAKNGLDPGIIIAMPFLFTAIAMRFGYASFSRKLEQRLENVTNALEDKVLEIGTLNQSTGGRQATSETVHDTTRRGPLLDLESDQDTSPESETRPNRNRDSV
ncbi:MAG: hypothetical protein HKN43_11160 [Rhodothermales bacterium]|nr:hypothetical protein [Rhodothermales bacterium]